MTKILIESKAKTKVDVKLGRQNDGKLVIIPLQQVLNVSYYPS